VTAHAQRLAPIVRATPPHARVDEGRTYSRRADKPMTTFKLVISAELVYYLVTVSQPVTPTPVSTNATGRPLARAAAYTLPTSLEGWSEFGPRIPSRASSSPFLLWGSFISQSSLQAIQQILLYLTIFSVPLDQLH
jgi:hypothetical protein